MGSFSAAPRPRSRANSSKSAVVAKSCGEMEASTARTFKAVPSRSASAAVPVSTRARAQLRPALDALVAEPGIARLIGGQHLDPAKLLFRPLQAAKGLEPPDQMVVQQEEISDILQRIGDLLRRQGPLRPVREGL